MCSGLGGACVLGVIINSAVGIAAEPTVQVAVTPAEVALTTGASASVSVVVSNPTAAPVNDLEITASADGSVKVESISSALTSIPAGGSTSATFAVTRKAEGTGQPVTVRFVVRFTALPATSASAAGLQAAVPQVAVASLKVTAAPSLPLLTAKFAGDVGAINVNRPGETALVVSNPRETAATIAGIQVTVPSQLKITLTCPLNGDEVALERSTTPLSCPLTIDPRSQQALPVRVEVLEPVTPGQRSLVMRIKASGGGDSTEAITVTLSLTVDVFAEADILKSVGVPVFLLLPGVIVVVSTWLLIGYATRWGRSLKGAFSGNALSAASALAVISLAVSLLIAWAYPWLTANVFPHQGVRDYLKAYGFVDFYYVIFYSFAVAVILWLLSWVAHWILQSLRSLLLPMPGDNAPTLLRKLALNGRTKLVRVSAANGVHGLAFGQIGGEPSDATLVVPQLSVTLNQGDPNHAALRDRLEHYRDGDNPLSALNLWLTVRTAATAVPQAATIGRLPDDVANPTRVANVTQGQRVPIVDLL